MLDYLRNLRKSSEEKQQEALNAYLDDALTLQQRQHVEKELASDPDLQAELTQMRAIQQQMRQLPQRQVPRNFMLDPALYGRPRREPLIQAYPLLRTATALTALIFVFALAANLFLGGTSDQVAESAEPLAMMSAPAAEIAFDEAVESEAEPESEMAAEEMLEETAALTADFERADDAIAGEQEMPPEAMEAPAFDSPEEGIVPQATMATVDESRQVLPTAEATEFARQLLPQTAPPRPGADKERELSSEADAADAAAWRSLSGVSIIMLLGVILLILLVLTLMARRRL